MSGLAPATPTYPGLERVTEPVDLLGESPLWSVSEQALYHVDLRRKLLLRNIPGSDVQSQWQFDEWVGAVVAADNGMLAIALASGIVRFDPATGITRAIVAPETAAAGNRLNDSKCDRHGRLWTSSMRDYGAVPTGALYRIGADLAPARMLQGISVPNAIAFSPDDRTFYFADSADGRLRAYAFDAERGELGDMRVLVDTSMLPGKPDGATVDADGCVWNARMGGGCVARITPRGDIDRIVALPVSQVASCAFGGA
ncbi:MAG: SMP-30/gluconolactonase/LRE family protein, partial [Casimicrobiaceae bacterium]